MHVDHACFEDSIVPIVSPFISRNRMRTFTLLAMWAAALGIVAWVAFAWLLPQNLRNTGLLYGLAVCVSFFGRVFQFHLGVALGVIALIAIVMRARYLAAIGGMFSIFMLCPTIASIVHAAPPPPMAAAGSNSIRVMSANLLASNRWGDGILYQIHQAHPDVIAFQEYSDWADELLQHELTEYPYRIVEPKPDSTGSAIYSKLPMTGELQYPHNELGTRLRIRATLHAGDREVVLYDIHPSSPHRYGNILRNRLQTADLIDDLKKETLPVIVAGDFNATEATPNLQAYGEVGLVSAHDVAGFARGSTWPSITWLRHLPGVQIDHILISKDLTCTHQQVGGPTGSDHRPVIADVSVAPTE